MKIEITLDEFEDWLLQRGYDNLMGDENFRMFLQLGMASLFFTNSALLMSCIFSKLGLQSERIDHRARFAISRKIKEIKADHYRISITLE
ncbi:hypothetical protein DRP07_10000 [Archaeoglobales archaeon]|nr:MAG: hypothetical protein DRP07_10000 [Archaeoglobales archaeon]